MSSNEEYQQKEFFNHKPNSCFWFKSEEVKKEFIDFQLETEINIYESLINNNNENKIKII